MLTRLQAINEIMVAVGEQVILVEVAGAGDYANASAVIDSETRKVLAKGWDFNTDKGVTLTPDVAGTISLPDTTLQVDPQDPESTAVQRGNAMYDPASQSAVFSEPLVVDMVVLLPFEQVPHHVQKLIVAQATKAYQRGYVGSGTLDQFALQDLQEARADAYDAESDVDDYNILDNPDLSYLRRRSYRYTGGF